MEIEKLDLDVKTYNRLKKLGAETVEQLLIAMYQPESWRLISQPDMKRVEQALKAAGIIKYMRGDEVSEEDIEPEPLTWDELHGYVGKLVVHDDSSESHRWLHLCWIYNISDEGETNMSYISRGNSYCGTRKAYVEDDNLRRVEFAGEMLRHEGHFFALKEGVWLMNTPPELPHGFQIGDKIDYADFPELFGEELTFEALMAEPAGSVLLIWPSAFAGSTEQDVRQALIGRIVQVMDAEDGAEFATASVDLGSHSPMLYDFEDFEAPEDVPESEQSYTWNWYTRAWRLRTQEAAPEPKTPETAIVPAGEAAPAEQSDPDAYEQAIQLHRRIQADLEVTAASIWDMGNALKEMRDGKHYKALLYANFEAYCTDAVGMSRPQAYKLITIAENLTAENVYTYRQIGTSKLALLAAVTDTEREEITAHTDIENVTVRELKAEIKKYKDEASSKGRQLTEVCAKWEKAEKEKKKQLRLREELVSDNGKMSDRISELIAKVDELESRPVEVAVQTDEAALEQLRKEHQAELSALRKEHEADLAELEQEYENDLAHADGHGEFRALLNMAKDNFRRMQLYLVHHRELKLMLDAKKAAEDCGKQIQALIEEGNNNA